MDKYSKMRAIAKSIDAAELDEAELAYLHTITGAALAQCRMNVGVKDQSPATTYAGPKNTPPA